jgi:hypothetical protein
MVYGYLIFTLRYKLIVDFVSDSMKQLRAMQARFPYFTNPDLAYYDMHARKATTTKFAAKYPSGSWEFGVASIFHDAHNQLGMSLSVCILPPNIYIYIYINIHALLFVTVFFLQGLNILTFAIGFQKVL